MRRKRRQPARKNMYEREEVEEEDEEKDENVSGTEHSELPAPTELAN